MTKIYFKNNNNKKKVYCNLIAKDHTKKILLDNNNLLSGSVIRIEVTAEDGTKAIYKIKITRVGLSNDATIRKAKTLLNKVLFLISALL